MIARVLKFCIGYWGFHTPAETRNSQPKDDRLLPEAMKMHYLPTGRTNSAMLSLMHYIEGEINVRLILEQLAKEQKA